MNATTFTQERIRWGCALAQPPHGTAPLLWERELSDREEAAMAALANWSWDGADAGVIASLCAGCWLRGCACPGSPLLPGPAGSPAGM